MSSAQGFVRLLISLWFYPGPPLPSQVVAKLNRASCFSLCPCLWQAVLRGIFLLGNNGRAHSQAYESLLLIALTCAKLPWVCNEAQAKGFFRRTLVILMTRQILVGSAGHQLPGLLVCAAQGHHCGCGQRVKLSGQVGQADPSRHGCLPSICSFGHGNQEEGTAGKVEGPL